MFDVSEVQRRRIALYSHDTQGLGHVRRNLAIAASLASGDPAPEILVITGAPAAGVLPAPPGADFLTLPAFGKRLDGRYEARSLLAPVGALIELRSRILQAALDAFDPDLLIVDKVPRGAGGELEQALEHLRATGRTRCVLGLRDVLDGAAVASREWHQQRCTEAVDHYYDAVWVYGDQQVFDPIAAYGLPLVVACRTTFTGYLGHGRPTSPPGFAAPVPSEPFALCMVGGGQDGIDLARSFVQARLPRGRRGVVLAGPYMGDDDREELDRLVVSRPDMTVVGYVDMAEQFIAAAEYVVSMGGYNSVCELLAHEKRTLVVPRARPRTEQLVRARRLAQRGLLDVVHPDELSPERLSAWMASGAGTSRGRRPVDLDGLARLPSLVDAILAPAGSPGRWQPGRRRAVRVAI